MTETQIWFQLTQSAFIKAYPSPPSNQIFTNIYSIRFSVKINFDQIVKSKINKNINYRWNLNKKGLQRYTTGQTMIQWG